LISALRQAVAAGNYEAALFMALTLPDICARVESEDGKTSGARYKAWFDRFLATKYRRPVGGVEHTFLSSGDCYALRCALLHEGSTEISSQRARDVLGHFQFTISSRNSVHLNQEGATLQIDIAIFCEEICEGVEQWLKCFANEHVDKVHRLNELLFVHVLGSNFRLGGSGHPSKVAH